MGQDHDHYDEYQAGRPICTHRDEADETQLILGRHPLDEHAADDISSPTVNINELHEYVNAQGEQYWQAMDRAFTNNEEARFTEDEDRRMHYEAKPPLVWLSGAFAAAFLFWLQHYIYLHHAAWGAPFGRLDGFVRLGLMLLGAYCAFVAWPWRRINGLDERELAKRAKLRRDVADRMRDKQS